MKLIIGLGNPGKEYENTRHNIGFFVVDYFLKNKNISLSWKEKFHGSYIETNLFGQKVLFLKPLSYMNLSGGVVRKYVDYYNIHVDDIFVISDDLDLSIGNFKLRDKGSSGGHNGLKDIEHSLGTDSYKRLKIGISNDKTIDTKDYVLGKLSQSDKKILEELMPTICNVIDDYFHYDFSILMNQYNRKNR